MTEKERNGEHLRKLMAMLEKRAQPKATWLDKVTVRLVRWGLSIALLVGVYTETGGFTTTALALGFIATEIQCWVKTDAS